MANGSVGLIGHRFHWWARRLEKYGRFNVGWVSFRAGQLDKAGLFLEQAGRLDPADAEILSHLGDLYAKRSEPERAVAAYRKALNQKPEERLRRRLEESLAGIESRRAAGR